MEACPRHIDHQKVFTDLMSLPTVVGVHSLRIWALKTNTLAATVHLELAKTEKCSADKVVALAQKKLTQGHRIRFATIQVDYIYIIFISFNYFRPIVCWCQKMEEMGRNNLKRRKNSEKNIGEEWMHIFPFFNAGIFFSKMRIFILCFSLYKFANSTIFDHFCTLRMNKLKLIIKINK